jgi:hypothetical protein
VHVGQVAVEQVRDHLLLAGGEHFLGDLPARLEPAAWAA